MKSITLSILVLTWVILFFGGCSANDTVVGEPTSLNGRDPVEIICEIQQKFIGLPKPVFTRINYYKPWKERRFAAGTYNWSESYDVILHDQAYAFIQEHSAIEINIALLPLVIDPEVGADVLALFDGMRGRGKKSARYPRVPTHLIGKYKQLEATQKYLKKYFSYHKSHYAGEQSRTQASVKNMQWDESSRMSYLLAENTFFPVHLPSYQGVEGTLENEIVAILKSYKKAKPNESGTYWRHHKDWTARPSLDIKDTDKIDKILTMNPSYLDIGINFKKFTDSYDEVLTTLVLLSRADVDSLGILVDLHKKYWLAYTTNWLRQSLDKRKKGRLYKQAMYEEIINTVIKLCNEKS